MASSVSLDPVIDDPGSHPQASSDSGDGLASGDFKDGQGATKHAGIVGVPELPFQATPLPGGQGQGSHGNPPLPGGYWESVLCEKTSAVLLSTTPLSPTNPSEALFV
jgi:hypothetical protein